MPCAGISIPPIGMYDIRTYYFCLRLSFFFPPKICSLSKRKILNVAANFKLQNSKRTTHAKCINK